MESQNGLMKYENPDRRCTYPFSPDPCGYCWTYANHVDGEEGYENIQETCKMCELFDETKEGL